MRPRSALVALSLTLAAFALLGRGGQAAERAATGRIAGTVRLTLARGATATASAYSRRAAGFKATPRPADIRSVVVFLSDARPAAAAGPMRAVLTQMGEQFVPHVVAVTVGSTVDFPNQDPFFHNVFSLSGPATFDLGRYQPDDSRSQRFTSAGLVKVFCHIHSQMSAIVRVFDHPWFTMPSDEGAFELDEVPPGVHTVVAWHERIGEQRAKVTVTPGDTATIEFALPVLEGPR